MRQNRIIGAIAPKGSGKTWTVAEYLTDKPRYIIFDPMGDSAYLQGAEDVINGRKELLEAVKQPEFRIVYRGSIIRDDKKGDFVAPDFEFVVDVALTVGDLLLVIDEAHILCDAYHIPQALFLAMLQGRRRQLSIIFVSHRFATVHRMLTTNTDEFWFWRIIEPSDLEGIRQRCGPDTMERVRNARKLTRQGDEVIPGEMVRWTIEDGGGEEHEEDEELTGDVDMDERMGG